MEGVWDPSSPSCLEGVEDVGIRVPGLRGIALAVLCGALAIGAYQVGRTMRDNQPSATADAPRDRLATTTTDQSGRPDTTQPSWARPYLDEIAQSPRFEEQVGIFTIAPGTDRGPIAACLHAEARWVGPPMQGPLRIEPRVLPPTVIHDVSQDEASACGEVIVNVLRVFAVPAEGDAERKVRSGEVSWFDLEHGGSIEIWRTRTEEPRYHGREIPSGNWTETSVAGYPAALGVSGIEELGHATVLVWDSDSKVLTVVRGLDRHSEELLSVAEGIFQ